MGQSPRAQRAIVGPGSGRGPVECPRSVSSFLLGSPGSPLRSPKLFFFWVPGPRELSDLSDLQSNKNDNSCIAAVSAEGSCQGTSLPETGEATPRTHRQPSLQERARTVHLEEIEPQTNPSPAPGPPPGLNGAEPEDTTSYCRSDEVLQNALEASRVSYSDLQDHLSDLHNGFSSVSQGPGNSWTSRTSRTSRAITTTTTKL